jgi:hypothetical protein
MPKVVKKHGFGYWKDDGFTKTKHKGRIDINEFGQAFEIVG